MTKLTTVVWDWNGTLLDDVQVSYRTVNRVLAQKDVYKRQVKDRPDDHLERG